MRLCSRDCPTLPQLLTMKTTLPSPHFDKGEDVLYDGLNQHNKFFGELLKDDKLMRQFLGLYIHDVYKTLRGEKQAACFVRTRPKQLLPAPGEPRIPAGRIRGRAAPIWSESRTSTCAPATLLQAGEAQRPWDSRAFSPAGVIGVAWSATRGESTCGSPTPTSPSHGPGRTPDYEVAVVFRNDNAGRIPPRTG